MLPAAASFGSLPCRRPAPPVDQPAREQPAGLPRASLHRLQLAGGLRGRRLPAGGTRECRNGHPCSSGGSGGSLACGSCDARSSRLPCAVNWPVDMVDARRRGRGPTPAALPVGRGGAGGGGALARAQQHHLPGRGGQQRAVGGAAAPAAAGRRRLPAQLQVGGWEGDYGMGGWVRGAHAGHPAALAPAHVPSPACPALLSWRHAIHPPTHACTAPGWLQL